MASLSIIQKLQAIIRPSRIMTIVQCDEDRIILEGSGNTVGSTLLRSVPYLPWVAIGIAGIGFIIYQATQSSSPTEIYVYQYILGIPIAILLMGYQLLSKVDLSISKKRIVFSKEGIESQSFYKNKPELKSSSKIYKLLWVSKRVEGGRKRQIKVLINLLDRLMLDFDLEKLPDGVTEEALQDRISSFLQLPHTLKARAYATSICSMHQKPLELPEKGGKNIGQSRISIAPPRLFIRGTIDQGVNIDLSQQLFTDIGIHFSEVAEAGFDLQFYRNEQDEDGNERMGCMAHFILILQGNEKVSLFAHNCSGKVSSVNWALRHQTISLCLYEATLLSKYLSSLTGISFRLLN